MNISARISWLLSLLVQKVSGIHGSGLHRFCCSGKEINIELNCLLHIAYWILEYSYGDRTLERTSIKCSLLYMTRKSVLYSTKFYCHNFSSVKRKPWCSCASTQIRIQNPVVSAQPVRNLDRMVWCDIKSNFKPVLRPDCIFVLGLPKDFSPV